MFLYMQDRSNEEKLQFPHMRTCPPRLFQHQRAVRERISGTSCPPQKSFVTSTKLTIHFLKYALLLPRAVPGGAVSGPLRGEENAYLKCWIVQFALVTRIVKCALVECWLVECYMLFFLTSHFQRLIVNCVPVPE